MYKFRLRIKQCCVLSKYLSARLLSLFLKTKPKYSDLWFVCERGTDARDNAYYFYCYIKKKLPHLNIIYCITEDSADYYKVKERGNTVRHGSFKHLILLNLAKYIVGTHNCGHLYERNLFSYKFREKYINNFNAMIIFLQHGIIHNYLNDLVYPNAKIDLFICGAMPEYEYVIKTYNHPSSIVKYTGLARYDNLHDFKVKKQILFMPTWRIYLNNVSDEVFSQSLYYKQFSSFLKNEELFYLLEQNNYELIFYPHYEFQKYIHLFENNNNRIKIADFDNYDVQLLLKESAILITDYSSVIFDFAYMYKPAIYFQFDKAEFLSDHYRQGYFDYKTMGFGSVVENEQELLKSLSFQLVNNCKIDLFYEERIKNFFPLYDDKNCDRIYHNIIEA